MFSIPTRLLGACLGALLLSACESHKPVEQVVSKPVVVVTPDQVPVMSQAETLARRFGPIISGGWISESYLQALRRTRSPEEAFTSIPHNGPVAFFIAPVSAAADSTSAEFVFNMHEGDETSIFFQPGQNNNSLVTNLHVTDDEGSFYELSYQVSPSDTTLYLVEYNTRKKEIHRIVYHKTPTLGFKSKQYEGSVSQCIENTVNDVLVAGNYVGIDSVKNRVNVLFTSTGEVRGLPSFNHYTVHLDFIGPSIGDELILDNTRKYRKEFACEYGRDTLRLFTILSMIEPGSSPNEPDSIEVFKRGTLRYTLIRRKP